MAGLGLHWAAPALHADVGNNSPLPKVYVNAFRGDAGETTSQLVRQDLERSSAFELITFESSDAYAIHAEATGGWVDAVVFKPDARVLFQRRYESPNLRQNVHRLADDFTEIVTKRPGIAGSIIAFVSDISGTPQIYLCDSDGEDIRQVTTDAQISGIHPHVSLTNSRIDFTTIKNGYADIWSIDLVTEERKRLINAPGDNRHPVLSPDGDRMAATMSYSGNTDLYITTAQGGRGRRLTEDAAIESDPTWAPDGRLIAFTRLDEQNSRSQVCYMSPLGGVAESFPDKSANSQNSHPDWSPDGKHIVFTLNSDGQNQLAIYEVATRKISVLNETVGGHSPSWAPDSRHLTYLNESTLWVLDAGNQSQRSKIIEGFGNISEPAWSR